MPPQSSARHTRSTRLGITFVAACGGLLYLAAPLPVIAHNSLVSSSPANGSTHTTQLHEITLNFNDTVLNLGATGMTSIVEVTGPDSTTHYETGCATTTNRSVTTPVALGEPGRYEVTYQIVSADGHTVSNTLTFTYQPPTGTTAYPGSPSAPPCAQQVGDRDSREGGTAESSLSSRSAGTRNDSVIVVALAIGVVVVAGTGVALGFALWRIRKTPRRE